MASNSNQPQTPSIRQLFHRALLRQHHRGQISGETPSGSLATPSIRLNDQEATTSSPSSHPTRDTSDVPTVRTHHPFYSSNHELVGRHFSRTSTTRSRKLVNTTSRLLSVHGDGMIDTERNNHHHHNNNNTNEAIAAETSSKEHFLLKILDEVETIVLSEDDHDTLC